MISSLILAATIGSNGYAEQVVVENVVVPQYVVAAPIVSQPVIVKQQALHVQQVRVRRQPIRKAVKRAAQIVLPPYRQRLVAPVQRLQQGCY